MQIYQQRSFRNWDSKRKEKKTESIKNDHNDKTENAAGSD
jgi:hypothetical protein